MLAPVQVVDARSFIIAGEPISVEGEDLVERLTVELYEQCYSRVFRGAYRHIVQAGPDPDLVEKLSAANTGRDRWDRDWTIEAWQAAEHYVVRKQGDALLAQPGQFALQDPYRWPPGFGARVDVFFPCAARRLQDAFYFAFGTAGSNDNAFDLVRLYWNVRLEGAPELLHLLTGILNSWSVPFRLKVLTIPAHYDRVDTGVLYVQRRHFALVSQLVAAHWAQLEALLDADVPLFTTPLARGLSWANNPQDGSSYGKTQCRQIARTLCQEVVRV